MTAAVGLRDRRDRERAGLTLIDGARELRRALDRGVEVIEAFVCEPLLAGPDARAALDRVARRAASTILPTSGGGLRQGRLRRARGGSRRRRAHPVDRSRVAWPPPTDALVVVIEGVEKPGNLGAVLRSADGAGADAVIAASPRTDLFNPNTIRASAGTVFAVPLAAAPTADVAGLAPRARLPDRRRPRRRASALPDADLTGRVAIVLGAEADGLTDAWTGDDIHPVRVADARRGR